MNLEIYIIRMEEITAVHQANLPEPESLVLILNLLKGLRTACNNSSISAVILAIQAYREKFPSPIIIVNKSDIMIPLNIAERLAEIHEFLCDTCQQLQLIDKSLSSITPQGLDEIYALLHVYQVAYIYKTSEALLPNCLYLPVCQALIPQLGQSGGVCEGFALEGIRGILEENKLFGREITPQPAFKASIPNKSLSSRQAMLENRTETHQLFFNRNIVNLQNMPTHMALVEQRHYATTVPAQVLLTIEQAFTKTNSVQIGYKLILEQAAVGTNSHVIGLARNNQGKLMYIDEAFGCFIFQQLTDFLRWFKWFLSATQYDSYQKIAMEHVLTGRPTHGANNPACPASQTLNQPLSALEHYFKKQSLESCLQNYFTQHFDCDSHPEDIFILKLLNQAILNHSATQAEQPLKDILEQQLKIIQQTVAAAKPEFYLYPTMAAPVKEATSGNACAEQAQNNAHTKITAKL